MFKKTESRAKEIAKKYQIESSKMMKNRKKNRLNIVIEQKGEVDRIV